MNICYFFIPLCIFTYCSSMDKVLSDAMLTCDVQTMESYLSRQPSLLNQRNGREGRTMLFDAASWGLEKTTRFLLEKGANPNIPDINGNTPLISVIAGSSKPSVIPYILMKGGADVNAHNTKGFTALHCACTNKYGFELVKSLLEHGANPNAVNQSRVTPLLLACYSNLTPFVHILLKYNADKSIAAIDGDTPLKVARRQHFSGVEWLLNGQIGMPPEESKKDTYILFLAMRMSKR